MFFFLFLSNCNALFLLAGGDEGEIPLSESEAKTRARNEEQRHPGLLAKIKNALFG